jgi:hypothetical protein
MGGATNGIQAALAVEVDSVDFLHEALIIAMDEVGRLFE